MKAFLIPLLFTWILVACSVGGYRGPSSVPDEGEKARKVQEMDFKLANLFTQEYALRQKLEERSFMGGGGGADGVRWEIEKQLEEIHQKISQQQRDRDLMAQDLALDLQTRPWDGQGPLLKLQMTKGFGRKTERLAIDDLGAFDIQYSLPAAFAMEIQTYETYELELQNKLPDPVKGEDPEVQGRLECDGDILTSSGFAMFKSEVRRKYHDFVWKRGGGKGQNWVARFSPEVKRCQLLFKVPQAPHWTHRMDLVALETLLPSVGALDRQLDICARPTGFPTQDPVAFFWQQDFSRVSCPRPIEKVEMYRDPIKAFNAKIRGLTGSDVPVEAIKRKNPTVVLNYSKVPQLDVIWVSSLNFSADFYGNVLAQALRYHADRGTQIRIMASEAMTLEKDKKILTKLQRGRPNVKIQYYQYKFTSGLDGSRLDKFHRINHTKLLIGYSEKNPQNNFLVTGGRNIQDSYLFIERPTYTPYPWLIDYARGERPFVYFDDFEIQLRATEVIKDAIAQLLQLWHRDSETNAVRSTNLNVARSMDPAQIAALQEKSRQVPMARHILSVPYSDKKQLETFYCEMIDSAQKEILLTTPYFRPSKKISEALGRASQRGVRVQVLTRIHLAGDDVPPIAEDVNKKGVNSHLKDLEMYEWTDPKSIMHAKLLVIDQKLSFISSVNLNARSFIHDTESGVLILHEGTAAALRKEILSYFQQSKRLSEKIKIKWLNGKIIDIFDSYF